MIRCLHRNSPRLISRILGAFLLVTFFTMIHSDHVFAQTARPIISLMIDGKGVISDVQPLYQNGRILVPIRVLAERSGAAVAYEADTRRVTLRDGAHQVAVFPDSRIGYVNGSRKTLDAAPVVIKKRTLVPIRFISESLGYNVIWDQRGKVAKIWTKPAVEKDREPLERGNPYIVQAGDTMEAIAKRHATSISAIQRNNVARANFLQAGQLLFLPEDARKAVNPLASVVDNPVLLAERYVFPFDSRSEYEEFGDSFGFGREWTETNSGMVRSHEGIDIMAPQGTPVYSVGDGVINRIGWNTYGGWRVNITDENGTYRMYYAHLEAYPPALQVGSTVRTGQLIGFVGTTGYGPPGTKGMFPPHLHFGLYRTAGGGAINPYYYLQYWESNKAD
ncbi:stalk domain-containing protein [Brevibacillus borstelensis]|uniref:stalk domain-containing protein n=1 Tax=Brevibacillus borstelensis TaxID=45462 RepID=UPI0030C4DA20